MSQAPVVIAGAGPTGLGAALGLARRGIRSIVLDPRKELGGLASTRYRGALPYKVGIHLLHPSEDELVPLVDEMCGWMGERLKRVRPRAAVHFLGRHLDYPFRTRQMLTTLGPPRAARVAASAAAARLLGLLPGSADGRESFTDVVRGAYGDAFYRLFFHDYTAKVLGLPPERIAGAWARRRVPMLTGRTLLQTLLPWWRPRGVEHAHSPFHRWQYSGPVGMDPLFEGMVEAAGDAIELRLGQSLQQVDTDDGRVTAAVVVGAHGRTERIATDAVVSSIPLTDLVAQLGAAPPEDVRNATAQLDFRGLVLGFFVVARPRLASAQWTYFQSAGLLFNRVSEFANCVPQPFGPDRTLVCAEMTAQPRDGLWGERDDAILARVRAGLAEVGWHFSDDELEDAFVVREPHGYPRWALGYEKPLAVALHYLDSIDGLHTVGRQGRFEYLNMDEAVAAGLEVAGRVRA